MGAITAGYFETLGLRLVRGRAFYDTDGTAGYESAILNQRLVAMHFPGEDPVGRPITLIDASPSIQRSPPTVVTIVGVAPTIRQRNFQDPQPDPFVYLPYRADPQRNAMLVVRAGDPGRVTSLVREEMRAIEPDLPRFSIQTMDQNLAQLGWPSQVFASMFAIFALIALVLSAVGLYAVTACSVDAAHHGVRGADGARPPAGAGEGAGAAARARDSLTMGLIAAVMVGAIAACVVPARRAMRLDRVSALRYEELIGHVARIFAVRDAKPEVATAGKLKRCNSESPGSASTAKRFMRSSNAPFARPKRSRSSNDGSLRPNAARSRGRTIPQAPKRTGVSRPSRNRSGPPSS